jgi:hypothetical protein
MKPLLRLAFVSLLALGLLPLRAHDHIEIGLDPNDGGRLGLSGPGVQLALYVPKGEPFSGYLPQFPGGVYADELTFSAEGNTLDFAEGSLPRAELVSVTGPAGAHFSFWEAGAIVPTWTRPTGWVAGEADRPSLPAYEDATGQGHIHGRAFSVDQPGTYEIVFRAVDAASLRGPSVNKTVVFNALLTPSLSIRLEGAAARLSFASRAGLTYDLQVSTTLADDGWSTIDWTDGTGSSIEFSDLLNGRPRVFYRLVEYR